MKGSLELHVVARHPEYADMTNPLREYRWQEAADCAAQTYTVPARPGSQAHRDVRTSQGRCKVAPFGSHQSTLTVTFDYEAGGDFSPLHLARAYVAKMMPLFQIGVPTRLNVRLLSATLDGELVTNGKKLIGEFNF